LYRWTPRESSSSKHEKNKTSSLVLSTITKLSMATMAASLAINNKDKLNNFMSKGS